MSNACPNDPSRKGKHNFIAKRTVKSGGKTFTFLECINCGKDIMEVS